MGRQLSAIGIHDTPVWRSFLHDYFMDVLRDPSNVARVTEDGKTIKESLLMGPRGGVKVETIWNGHLLETFKVYGRW